MRECTQIRKFTKKNVAEFHKSLSNQQLGKRAGMRIAICDDEKQICELLKEKIQRYYFAKDTGFSIQIFESGEKLLEYDLECIDVLFLDVDMPGKNGMDTAKAIREQNNDMLIIFLTAYSEFVFESFKVEAFRYLVKPLKNQELWETLEAAQKKLCEAEEHLNFQFQNEMYSVRYSDIIYIEGMRDKIWIYCKNATYRWRGTLKSLGERLNGKSFFQVHRSYIINMNKIKKYNSQTIMLEGGYEVPVSKYRLNEFKEEYIKFWSKIL